MPGSGLQSDRSNPVLCLLAGTALLSAASVRGDEYVAVERCRLKFASTVTLSSERVGVLAEIAEPGERIAAGAVVARLRDEPLRRRRETVESEATNTIEARFAAMSAQLAALKHERAAAANRTQPGVVSDLELRELRLAAEKAQLQLEQAEHTQRLAQLRLAEVDAELATLSVVSSGPGFVRAVHKKPGETVRSGEPLMEVVDTRSIRLEADVPAALAADLEVGDGVAFRVAKGRTVQAIIRFVDVVIEPVTQRVRVIAEAANPPPEVREGAVATMLVRSAAKSQSSSRTTERLETASLR